MQHSFDIETSYCVSASLWAKMTNVTKKLLFLLFFLSGWGQQQVANSAGASGEGGGYWSIQLSPNSVTSVAYRGRRISVWQHAIIPGR